MRIKIILIVYIISTVGKLYSQIPEKMSYQAVIRNNNDQLVTNSDIGMQISILQDSPEGTSVYIERHFPTTNQNGLISIVIGDGIVVLGNLAIIDWSEGSYFLKTETDLNGGANYTITGTNQILSVPYALHAKTADSLSGSNYYLGQEKDGGIIFYIYKGSDGHEHGLIVSKTESNAKWQNAGVLVNASHSWDGVFNTNLMTNSPAKTYVVSLGEGWYLPSIDELSILWHNRFHVNKVLSYLGSTLLPNTAKYWSSTEYNASTAWIFDFNNGFSGGNDKLSSVSVRAIRAF